MFALPLYTLNTIHNLIVMCFRYTDIKVPTKTIVSMIDELDIDNDGCISIGELIKVLKEHYAMLKRKRP